MKVKSILAENPQMLTAKGRNSMTPLHLGGRKGQKEVVHALTAKGAEVKAGNNKRSTPLDIAVTRARHCVVELLRKHSGVG